MESVRVNVLKGQVCVELSKNEVKFLHAAVIIDEADKITYGDTVRLPPSGKGVYFIIKKEGIEPKSYLPHHLVKAMENEQYACVAVFIDTPW